MKTVSATPDNVGSLFRIGFLTTCLSCQTMQSITLWWKLCMAALCWIQWENYCELSCKNCLMKTLLMQELENKQELVKFDLGIFL